MPDENTESTDTGKTGTETKNRSLEDMLSGLDDADRATILGEVRKGRDDAAKYRTQLRDSEEKARKYDDHVKSQQTETEKAQADAKAADERANANLNRAVRAEVKALARDFADPGDAHAFLGDLTKYVDKNGDIDDEQISADLKALLERKAYLKREAETEQRQSRQPRPDRSQASGGNGQTTGSDNAQKFADFMNRQLRR